MAILTTALEANWKAPRTFARKNRDIFMVVRVVFVTALVQIPATIPRSRQNSVTSTGVLTEPQKDEKIQS